MGTRWAIGPPKKAICEYSLATPVAEIKSLMKTKSPRLCVLLCHDLTTTSALPLEQFCEVFLANWEEYGCSQKCHVLKMVVYFIRHCILNFHSEKKERKNYVCVLLIYNSQ